MKMMTFIAFLLITLSSYSQKVIFWEYNPYKTVRLIKSVEGEWIEIDSSLSTRKVINKNGFHGYYYPVYFTEKDTALEAEYIKAVIHEAKTRIASGIEKWDFNLLRGAHVFFYIPWRVARTPWQCHIKTVGNIVGAKVQGWVFDPCPPGAAPVDFRITDENGMEEDAIYYGVRYAGYTLEELKQIIEFYNTEKQIIKR